MTRAGLFYTPPVESFTIAHLSDIHCGGGYFVPDFTSGGNDKVLVTGNVTLNGMSLGGPFGTGLVAAAGSKIIDAGAGVRRPYASPRPLACVGRHRVRIRRVAGSE